MARSITLTLGAGLGADLGPNFNLTADVGSVTPSTATKSELTAGKSVSVDDLATQVTVTSTGTCTNAITQTIPCAGGTTTSTTTTTASPLTSVTINLCAGGADGSGNVDVYAYSSIAVDTQISIPFRWTGDLASELLGTVLINSGQSCGTVNVTGATPGENFSILEFVNNISPQQSLNQEYSPLFAGSGSPCTSC